MLALGDIEVQISVPLIPLFPLISLFPLIALFSAHISLLPLTHASPFKDDSIHALTLDTKWLYIILSRPYIILSRNYIILLRPYIIL